MSPFFCLWNPESPRAEAFSRAVRERWGPPPESMTWEDFLGGRALPPLGSDRIIRIDSPGRNWAVERLLLARGASQVREPDIDVIPAEACHLLQEEPGRISASRQHHLGFRECLQELQVHFERQGAGWMQHPEDIEVMCDKVACHARLRSHGVHVPPSLGLVSGFDDLMARMDEAGRHRVFLKLCHGSSASGTVALECSVGRIQAFSTSRMKLGSEGVSLHNWRAITRYEDLRVIRQLVDAVCRHRAHAEVWLPKAGWRGRRFDVRVVVIGGQARQVVARLAEGPFTNLQTGAQRASEVELREHIGFAAFSAMCTEAERAMACFPRSLYGGVDVLLDARRHRPHILEVNAFGDLLPGVFHEGLDSYSWEVRLAMEALQVSTTGT